MPATRTSEHPDAEHDGGGAPEQGHGHGHQGLGPHPRVVSHAPLAPAVTAFLDLLLEFGIAGLERGTDADPHQGHGPNDVPGPEP